MDLSWIQGVVYGFISGLTDILPVSAQAHKILLLKFFGTAANLDLLNFMIRMAVMGALYLCFQTQLVRINRARALARIPKKKRNRPLDTRSLMDWSFLKTMVVPVILVFFIYRKIANAGNNLILTALFLFLNGVVLYLPQFFPTGNRDSRTLSRIEGLLMGIGGATSVLPGFSSIGSAISVASICGVERNYALNMSLMMNFVVNAGFAVFDIRSIAANGIGMLSFMVVVQYLVIAATAFCGTFLAIRVMRRLAENSGYLIFAFYCWGIALFTFILNLIA